MSDEKLEFNLPPVPSEILNPEGSQDEDREESEHLEPLASGELASGGFEEAFDSDSPSANSAGISEGPGSMYAGPMSDQAEPTTFEPPPPPYLASSPVASSASTDHYRSPAYADEHTFFPPPPTPAPSPDDFQPQPVAQSPIAQPPAAQPPVSSGAGNASEESAATIDPLLQYRGQEQDYYQPESAAPPPRAARRSGRHRAGMSSARFWIQLAIMLGVVILAVVMLRVFVLESFYITSDSMAPTLNSNDRILVNKLSSGRAGRGDLVVFNRPETDSSASNDDLVKRVVALEGERITFLEGRVFIGELLLVEPYLEEGLSTGVAPGNRLFEACVNQTSPNSCTLAPGYVYVLGDNREFSYDSRFFGPIPKSSIVGRAFWRVWPIGDFGGI